MKLIHIGLTVSFRVYCTAGMKLLEHLSAKSSPLQSNQNSFALTFRTTPLRNINLRHMYSKQSKSTQSLEHYQRHSFSIRDSWPAWGIKRKIDLWSAHHMIDSIVLNRGQTDGNTTIFQTRKGCRQQKASVTKLISLLITSQMTHLPCCRWRIKHTQTHRTQWRMENDHELLQVCAGQTPLHLQLMQSYTVLQADINNRALHRHTLHPKNDWLGLLQKERRR